MMANTVAMRGRMLSEHWGARMNPMPSRFAVRRAVAVAFLAAAAVGIALPASAHAALTASDPADGATVTELSTVRLEFSEELLEIGNSITVMDGAGASQDLTVTLAEPNVLEAPVTSLAPGAITISWRNASVDGHTEEGELHVTLDAPAAPETPSPSASPGLTIMPVDVSSPSPSPSAVAVDGGSGVSPWLFALLGLLVVGGAAAAIIAATRRPPYEDQTPSEN